ncbi:MAG: NAD(P)H-hydrate dehydratase, partial [Gammaproteobacteria bacterium]
GIPTADVQRDRLSAVTALAERYQATVVLKGAGTLISAPPDGAADVRVCLAGNPGMATAGTGDVLSGIAGGVLAQCRDVRSAAYAAVLIHALAGDAAAAAQGERGLVATDLLGQIQPWTNLR